MRILPYDEPMRTMSAELFQLSQKYITPKDRPIFIEAVAEFAAILIDLEVDYFDPPNHRRDAFVAAIDRAARRLARAAQVEAETVESPATTP